MPNMAECDMRREEGEISDDESDPTSMLETLTANKNNLLKSLSIDEFTLGQIPLPPEPPLPADPPPPLPPLPSSTPETPRTVKSNPSEITTGKNISLSFNYQNLFAAVIEIQTLFFPPLVEDMDIDSEKEDSELFVNKHTCLKNETLNVIEIDTFFQESNDGIEDEDLDILELRRAALESFAQTKKQVK